MKGFATCILIFFLTQQGLAQAHVQNYRDAHDGKGLKNWSGPLMDLQQQLDPNKNYAIAIIHKPVNAFLFQKMHWFRSTVVAARNELIDNHFGQLGHFQVAWQCRLPNGKKHIGMTGQSGEVSSQGVEMLTEQGYGLSVFFATFTDGYLQSSRRSARRIYKSAPSYGFQWVAIEISSRDCQNGLAFLNEYIRRRSYRNFSFALSPAHYQGGGCTSFATELLYKFGAFSRTIVERWKTKFKIPKNYIANPANEILPRNTHLPQFLNQEFYKKNKASLFAMSYLPDFSTSRLVLTLYDPELIIYSLKEMINVAVERRHNLFPSGFRGFPARRAYGLKYGSAIQSGPSSSFVYVDEGLHQDFRTLYHYIRSPKRPLPDFHYAELAGVPGIVLSRKNW